MENARSNYTTTEKEFLSIVYAFNKFRPYLVCSHYVVYTNHAAIKFLLNEKKAKPRLIGWILLLQEFDIEVKDKKGAEYVVADHLSRIHDFPIDEIPIQETLHGEKLMQTCFAQGTTPWYADAVNYLVCNIIPRSFGYQNKKKFMHDVKEYFWGEPYLFKHCQDDAYKMRTLRSDIPLSFFTLWGLLGMLGQP
jgi:hypothetical protein